MMRKGWGCPGESNLGRRKGVSAICLFGYVRAECRGVFVGVGLVGEARGSSC